MPLKLLFFIIVLISPNLLACDMVMGYRTSERLPFIDEQPSHQGLYFSLYQKALKSIHCKLTVIRAPKKRILKMINDGEIDFYPGLGYSVEREKSIHFIENGFMSHSVAISHVDIEDIHQLSDMSGKVLLTAIGSNLPLIDGFGIYLRKAYDLSIDTAVELLENKRVDFYLYNQANLRYYLKKKPNKHIKIHPCCSQPSPMYMGFSKKSKYSKNVINPDYQSSLPHSAENTLQILSSDSKAYAFKLALKTLKNNGEITKLERHYYD